MTRSKYMILNRRSLKGNKTRNAKSFFQEDPPISENERKQSCINHTLIINVSLGHP